MLYEIKKSMNIFHIICVLFGYLFLKLYTLLPECEQYLHKSLPIILKNYFSKIQSYVVLYIENKFGVLTLFELMEFHAHCTVKRFKNYLKIF